MWRHFFALSESRNVDVQTLNNSFNQLVSDYRGYLAFGRQSIEIMKKLWVQYDGLIDIMFELKDKKELEEVNELSRSQSTLIIIVEIIDYGLGIPESPKDKLFTKFYRVDNSDRRKIGGSYC